MGKPRGALVGCRSGVSKQSKGRHLPRVSGVGVGVGRMAANGIWENIRTASRSRRLSDRAEFRPFEYPC